jgi:ankyrin repeat protein
MVKLLLEMGADVNLPSHKYHKVEEREISPLMMAILAPYTRYSMDIFNYLLSQEADINYTTYDGYTVLMVVAAGRHAQQKRVSVYNMAETLLKRGASLSPRNQRGENVMDIALARNFAELAALFNQARFRGQ